ncbi:MAG: hypothetical protein ACRC1Z_13630 [Waterburya sp.]
MTQSLSTTKTNYKLDLSDSVPDITTNVIHDSRFNQLPSDIFESVIFQALNELIDDFALHPDKYLKPKHRSQIDALARDCLDRDLDKSDLHFYFGEHN